MPERSPLDGRRIVVTRAGEAGERLAARLRARGAEPITRSSITITPPADWTALDTALDRLGQFDWLVCTSANAVAAVFDRLATKQGTTNRLPTLRIAAVGKATAAAFTAAGWPVDVIPATQTAEELVAALGDVAGHKILFPASDIARPNLTDGLRARGGTVTSVVAYRTVAVLPRADEPLVVALRDGAIDAVTFTSPSTVRGFLPLLALAGPSTLAPAIVCVGPVTAAAARESGLTVSMVAAGHSEAGLLEALCTHFGQSLPSQHHDMNLVEGAR